MADKKKAKAVAEEPKLHKGTGVEMEGVEVKEGETATIVSDDAPQGKNIDERMADLQADLEKMGAR